MKKSRSVGVPPATFSGMGTSPMRSRRQPLFSIARIVSGIVPHSGQRVGVARRSYPQVRQVPGRWRFVSNRRRTVGRTANSRTMNQCGTETTYATRLIPGLFPGRLCECSETKSELHIEIWPKQKLPYQSGYVPNDGRYTFGTLEAVRMPLHEMIHAYFRWLGDMSPSGHRHAHRS